MEINKGDLFAFKHVRKKLEVFRHPITKKTHKDAMKLMGKLKLRPATISELESMQGFKDPNGQYDHPEFLHRYILGGTFLLIPPMNEKGEKPRYVYCLNNPEKLDIKKEYALLHSISDYQKLPRVKGHIRADLENLKSGLDRTLLNLSKDCHMPKGGLFGMLYRDASRYRQGGFGQPDKVYDSESQTCFLEFDNDLQNPIAYRRTYSGKYMKTMREFFENFSFIGIRDVKNRDENLCPDFLERLPSSVSNYEPKDRPYESNWRTTYEPSSSCAGID